MKEKEVKYLTRDIIGLTPLFYSIHDKLEFSSERKELEKKGIWDSKELNPRQVLKWDGEKLEFKKRKFFTTKPENKKIHSQIVKELTGLVIDAVSKNIPDQKFGILFSGGIDSTIIAFICKQLGVDFICYTAALDEPGMSKAEDLEWAEKIASNLGFELKVKKVKLKEVEKYIKKIVPLIESSNVVKVGVALPLFIACEMAHKDGIKVIYSGLGSEEIFAGYERHAKSKNVNLECLNGLKMMHERDLYRDYMITTNNQLELKVPFLDHNLVDYALKIPSKYKINDAEKKIILREVALSLRLEKEFALRKKRAAQYGSKFDRGLKKLSGNMKKSEYLKQFYRKEKLGALFSSGKDSTYALHLMRENGFPVECLITIKSKNPDSYMYHTPSIDLVNSQAEAMGIALIEAETKGEKEKELKDLEKVLEKAKNEFKLDGIITGALFSKYQGDRIGKICKKLGLKVYSPLWHKRQDLEMREIIDSGFKIIFTAIAAEGLGKEWLGKVISHEDIDRLVELNKKIGLNIAGEGGEFESFVLDGPMFNKKIKIIESSKEMENECTGRLIIKKIELV